MPENQEGNFDTKVLIWNKDKKKKQKKGKGIPASKSKQHEAEMKYKEGQVCLCYLERPLLQDWGKEIKHHK